MATYVKFQQFVEDLCKGVHDFTSDATCSVTVGLTPTLPSVSADAVLVDVAGVISYTNLSSRIITGITVEHATGTVTMTATDLVLTSSGGTTGPFQYVFIYNDDPTSPADPLIAYWDYGSSITLQDGETLTLDFTTGIFTLA